MPDVGHTFQTLPRVPMHHESTAAPHLTPEEVGAYVDRSLGADDMTRADAHLSACDACRAEVVEVRRLLRDAPESPHTAWWRRPSSIAAVAALAAAIAFILVPRDIGGPRATMNEPVRGVSPPVAPAPERPGIAIVSPAPRDTVDRRGFQLVWRAAGAEATYRVYLMEPDGSERWSQMTGDTAIAVPASLGLRPGATYRWYVEALHADGRSERSVSEPFTVAP